jgi:hypothetical protein
MMAGNLSRGLIAAALAGAAWWTATPLYADGPEAIATAGQHARLAAASDDIDGVRLHLHHTLNCLVGPDGDGFDASAGNPCRSAGGAIPQTADGSMRDRLNELADEVREGLRAAGDLADARRVAESVRDSLAGI